MATITRRMPVGISTFPRISRADRLESKFEGNCWIRGPSPLPPPHLCAGAGVVAQHGARVYRRHGATGVDCLESVAAHLSDGGSGVAPASISTTTDGDIVSRRVRRLLAAPRRQSVTPFTCIECLFRPPPGPTPPPPPPPPPPPSAHNPPTPSTTLGHGFISLY